MTTVTVSFDAFRVKLAGIPNISRFRSVTSGWYLIMVWYDSNAMTEYLLIALFTSVTIYMFMLFAPIQRLAVVGGKAFPVSVNSFIA
jgi:hypothetical protein